MRKWREKQECLQEFWIGFDLVNRIGRDGKREKQRQRENRNGYDRMSEDDAQTQHFERRKSERTSLI